MTIYLELGDYCEIAAELLGTNAEQIARLPRIALADSALFRRSGRLSGFDRKAAVLVEHLARNHPLPDGNKRAAFLSMVGAYTYASASDLDRNEALGTIVFSTAVDWAFSSSRSRSAQLAVYSLGFLLRAAFDRLISERWAEGCGASSAKKDATSRESGRRC